VQAAAAATIRKRIGLGRETPTGLIVRRSWREKTGHGADSYGAK
jgi:hypothetical protein